MFFYPLLGFPPFHGEEGIFLLAPSRDFLYTLFIQLFGHNGLVIKGHKIILTNRDRGVLFSGVVQRVTHRPIPARTAKWIRCRAFSQAYFGIVCRPASN